MFVARTNEARRKTKRHLFGGCALAACLAALANATPSHAQVAGTHVFVSAGGGSNVVNNGATNTTTVTLTANQSIIHWVPTDSAPTGGAIDILPAGSTWNFVGNGDYVVLNRFVDASGGAISRLVGLNGTVNGYVGAVSGPQGGNIWFYNAGGILIGSSGVINVGSLVLTSNDIDTSGGLLGPSGEIRFRGAFGSVAPVTINGTINAAQGGNPGASYVAVVAPRIVQAGTVMTDGSTALVAAEQADIRINNGLFDINVLVGAEGGTVIDHSGTTSGPAHQDGDADQNRVYLVAIPKNSAVGMLVSGRVGYQDAMSPQVEADGSVRLSAGYNILGGEIDATPPTSIAANIDIADTIFESSVFARASGSLTAGPLQQLSAPPLPVGSEMPDTAGRFIVRGDGLFIGDAGASLFVGANQQAGATGNLLVQSQGTAGVPGNALVDIGAGATVEVLGALDILANGASNLTTGDSQGGSATLNVAGALAANQVFVTADGIASGNLPVGGTGTGGTAAYNQTGGSVRVTTLSVRAQGVGGTGSNGSGNGIGGLATIDLSGGTIGASSVEASADGAGAPGASGSDENPLDIIPARAGGSGQGGDALIMIGGTATANIGSIGAYSYGSGGNGGDFVSSRFDSTPEPAADGGAGSGGFATVDIRGGTVSAIAIVADSSGFGGTGGAGFSSSSSGAVTGVGVGGNGGAGLGGVSTIHLAAQLDPMTFASSAARGIGGDGGAHNVGGTGGLGAGGLAQAIVDDFDAGILGVTLDAHASGGMGGNGVDGDGGAGGEGDGGTAQVVIQGPNGRATAVQANVRTDGTGGNGGNGALGFGATAAVAPSGGDGGTGRGGTLALVASEGGTLELPSGGSGPTLLQSGGTGGNGGSGANGAFPDGAGGNGGNGGAGSGGTVLIVADGGTVTSNATAVTIDARGTSGSGGAGGTGSGTGANGSNGLSAPDQGGHITIEALSSASGTPGLVTLGDTIAQANGALAGRIALRTGEGGTIQLASLDAEALGVAPPTSGDPEAAPTGIYLGAAGGTIATAGSMTLTTDSSVGVSAVGGGAVGSGGDMTIFAGDLVDVHHAGRANGSATISSGGSFSATAGTTISGMAGSLIAASGAMTFDATGPNGAIALDSIAADSIQMSSTGASSVEHAEAVNDFAASAGSFRTGLNSIITGGNITIGSPGAVDLGNSSAGGFVFVDAQSIDFNSIVAGETVDLLAGGTAPGAEGITGGSIAAGRNINLLGNSIAVAAITGDASLAARASGGNLGIGQVDVAGFVTAGAAGDLTGDFNAGGDLALAAGGNIVASVNAAGGFPDPQNGDFPSAGNAYADAGGNVSLTNSSAAGMIGVNADGAVTIANASAGEDMLVLAGTTANLTDITAGDDLGVRAPGDIVIDNAATTGAGLDGFTLTFTRGAGFAITQGPGGSSLDGADISLVSNGGAINATTVSAGDDILLDAATSVALNGATTLGVGVTGGDSSVRTRSGTATSLVNINARGDVQVDAGGAATLSGTVDAGRDIAVVAAGAITGATVAAIGNANLASSGGAVTVTALGVGGAATATGTSVAIAGPGTLNFTNVTATAGDAVLGAASLSVANANIAGTARLDGTAGTLTLGNIAATTSIVASAQTNLQVGGVVTAPDMSLRSADIAIGTAGRIGTAGTTTRLALANNNSANQTFIGGTGTRTGYHLDAAEMTRLFGASIDIFAPDVAAAGGLSVGSSAPPDLVVDAFSIAAGTGSNVGSNGTLALRTPGKMRVVGAVAITGASADNGLELAADDALEVILGQGSVHMVNGSVPTGLLRMASDDIIVATPSAIADVAAAASVDEIETRLAQNDGVLIDEGALVAGGIDAVVSGGGFYVQNSGAGTASNQRRGLTFGAQGLNVEAVGSNVRIVVNGVHTGTAGQVTGVDALALLTINGAAPTAGSFDPRSRVNSCLIATPLLCSGQGPGQESEGAFPVQDIIGEVGEDDERDGGTPVLATALISLRDLDPLTGEPLLDDPVTGAGNDDLWIPPAD